MQVLALARQLNRASEYGVEFSTHVIRRNNNLGGLSIFLFLYFVLEVSEEFSIKCDFDFSEVQRYGIVQVQRETRRIGIGK